MVIKGSERKITRDGESKEGKMPYTQREKGERKRGGKDKPDGETEMGVFRSGRAHKLLGS